MEEYPGLSRWFLKPVTSVLIEQRQRKMTYRRGASIDHAGGDWNNAVTTKKCHQLPEARIFKKTLPWSLQKECSHVETSILAQCN